MFTTLSNLALILSPMEFLEYLQSTNELGKEQTLDTGFQWIFWMLMAFNLIAVAFVRTVSPGYITVLFRTGIYNRLLYQNVQEDLKLNSAGSVLLTLAYFNCFAIIGTSLIPSAPVSFVWTMLLIAAGILIAKFVLIRILGFLSETKEGLTEHWINHLVYFQIISLILTPALCLTHFMSQTVQKNLAAGMVAFIVLLIFVREIQSFMRAIRQRISIVYIILYLCTLELVPLVILIRLLGR